MLEFNSTLQSTDISEASNINEVLEIGKGNWETYPSQIMTVNGIDIPKKKALLRNDNNYPLGIVGDKYEVISNAEAYSFFDTLVADKQAEYKSYQEYDGGKRVVITARYGKAEEIRVGDYLESEIRMVNSFDGSTSFQVMFNALRLACSNGMVSRSKENFVSIRHTANKDQKIKDAFTVLNSAQKCWADFILKSKNMAETMADHNMVENYFNSLLNIDPLEEKENKVKTNKKERMIELFNDGMGNTGNSVFDLYNGATEWYQHEMGKDADKRAVSNLFANGQGFKQSSKALDLALELV